MQEQIKDYLVRGTAWGGKIRVFAVRTTRLVEELRKRHDTLPTATAALGRTLSIGAMMGAMLKGKEKLTIQVKGDGPIGQVLVDANADGELRGYVDHPRAHHGSNEQGKLDVAGAVGTTGYVHVTKDLGLKEPYRGSVPIISGELGEDFTYYFAVSEQTPSAVGAGVLVDEDNSVLHAGGFIVQLMPGLTDAEITRLEGAIGAMPPVTTLLAQGESPEDLLKWVVGEEDLVIHDTLDVVFKCQCSTDRVEQTLISLGKEELEAIIREEGKAEVVCQFCNEAYTFERPQLEALVEQVSK
ncbi:Hsp33 family molecular chaperone HslO [Paenibacillus sp. GCM10027627]|uniref:Hsp33 family molecular chaperone HslO n=1 Tax=unclassified Paenibacillus TaxID=185978 RepID=UPI003638F641